jgi:hypothetical protein
MEHHSALVRVVEAGEYGTAGAILRPLLEAATTGFWFVYVARCDEVIALPTAPDNNPVNDTPGLTKMLEDLEPIFPDIRALSDGFKKGGMAKWLHKYTHGSTPQLTRRIAGGWSDMEVIRMLIQADMFACLAGSLETVIALNDALSAYAFGTRDELGFELQSKFRAAEIPQRPHRHPEAPLLCDGCGPPFG